MSKVGKFLKNNIKLFVGIIIGGILFGGATYVIATSIASSNITYTSNGQTTVEGALNDLYSKANTWIDPDTYPLKMNSAGTIWATLAGLCIKRNGVSYCFGTNNFIYEKDHIQQVFSDISCYAYSSIVRCNASDFLCEVNSQGYVGCYDQSEHSSCEVNGDGSVNCD